MQNREKMMLYKQRDFGDQISATFEFIKLNIKRITMNYLVFSLPLVIIGSVLYAGGYTDLIQNVQAGQVYTPMSVFSGQIIIGGLLLFVASLFFIMSNYAMMKLYHEVEDPNEINVAMVYDVIKSRIGHYILGGIAVGVISVLGTLLLVLPGIYVMVAMMFTFIIIIFEGKNAFGAIDRSFQVQRGFWWGSFGFIIVMAIIISLISYTIVLPISLIYDFSPLELMSGTVAQDFEHSASKFLIVTVLSNSLTYFISSIYVIAIGIRYFTIVESKEDISLNQEIDSMTSNSNNEA